MIYLLKKPTAWIPIALSFAVITMWVVSLSFSGAPQHEPDEGTAAHLFQIWLVLEIFLIGLFSVMWLPKMPKQALIIVAIQIIFVLAGCAPVRYFHL